MIPTGRSETQSALELKAGEIGLYEASSMSLRNPVAPCNAQSLMVVTDVSPKRIVQVDNPTSLLAQKILIHDQRDHRDKAKDLLYMHDTVEVFSENLEELRHIFRKDI
jgi:hypothetical protein